MRAFMCILVGLLASVPIYAEEGHDHRMAATSGDDRQLVNYPPEVRVHALANMRGHLQALADIMDALANAQYVQAAEIADKRLGMNSPGAAGCRMDGMNNEMVPMSETVHLDHQMSRLMPEKMRELGQNMHRAANEFAVKARETDKNPNNIGFATAALAKVTQQCIACHASYRMQ